MSPKPSKLGKGESNALKILLFCVWWTNFMTGVNKSGVRLSSSHHNILYHQNKTVMILSFKIRYSLKFCLSPYIVDSKQVFDIGDNLSDKLKQQRLFSNSRTCFPHVKQNENQIQGWNTSAWKNREKGRGFQIQWVILSTRRSTGSVL